MKIILISFIISVSFLFGCDSGSKKSVDENEKTENDVEAIDNESPDEAEVVDINDETVEEDNEIIDIDEEVEDEDLSNIDEDEIVDEDIVTGPPLGCLQGEYEVYYGNFHSHTSNSDGQGDPETAFIYARDVAEIDSLAVTDHLEQLYTFYGLADDDFPDCIDTANSLSDENFLAICGFEYGSGFEVSIETGLNISTGHSNVFFTEKLFPVVQLDFRDYYTTLQNCFECVAQFNHPGDEETQTFNEFETHPEVFNKIALYEFNGAGDVWNLLFVALQKGWYLSPTYNQDNHSANWGNANDNRTGVFMNALTKEGLKDAFLNRRTFATSDKNAKIKMMADDICWMGSQLQGVSKVKISVSVSDPDEEGFEKIELFDVFQNIIASKNCADNKECELVFDLDVPAPMHVLARAVQTDGQFLVSSPIWLMP